MNGLELSKAYYKEFGEGMLKERFPDLSERIATGLIGSGSECLGYDDEISRDHDFEPGFCIFIPGEDVVSSRECFLLERAYAKLPDEFMGFKRQQVSPVGGNRHGVIRLEDFFVQRIGSKNGELTDTGWLRIPEHYLLEVTAGEIYFDGYGLLTKVRENLRYMPEDVRKKKLAGHLLSMAQSGQYNYYRLVKRSEEGAAQLALCEYVKSGIQVVYLLNRTYMPYYKWAFRGMRDLPVLSGLEKTFEMLLTTPNDEGNVLTKANAVEDAAGMIIAELKKQMLSEADCGDLEKHAYSVNDSVKDNNLRYMHILAGV